MELCKWIWYKLFLNHFSFFRHLLNNKKLGRNFIGIEREAQYCIWTQQRLNIAEKNKQIQGLKDGVFWERNSLKEQEKRVK